MAEELSKTLAQLAECEQKMGDAEKEVEIFRIKKTQAIYADRRAILAAVPQFWYIVMAQNDDFAEYVPAEDLKWMDFVEDIYVEYPLTGKHHRDFVLSVTFGGEVPKQTVKKAFFVHEEDGEEKLTAEGAAVEWPAELADVCPATIRAQKKDQFTADQKKRYRQGMKSFFAFFEWTGEKPGKEFKAGEDLARLIVDDIFPNAVRYYVEAANQDESEVDLSEGEELDLSEDEPERKRQKGEKD